MSKDTPQQPPSANPAARKPAPNEQMTALPNGTPAGGTLGSDTSGAMGFNPGAPPNPLQPWGTSGGNPAARAPAGAPPPTALVGANNGQQETTQPTGTTDPQANTNPNWTNFLGSNNADVLAARAAAADPTQSVWTPHDPGGGGNYDPSTYSTNPAARGPAAPAGGMVGPANTAPSTLPPGTSPGAPQRSIDTSNVPGLVGGDALRSAMQQAQDAAYKTATGYLDPQYKNQESDLTAKLANQGIPQGSEAYQRAMDEFARNKQFAYSQAESGAVQQGNAAQSQLFNQGLAANANQFGQNMQQGQFSEQVRSQLAQEGFTQQQIDNLEQQHRFDNSMTMRNQDINELLLGQQNPLNMLNALNGGGQVQQPNFTNTPSSNVAGTDIAGITNQSNTQANNVYNAQTGATNSANTGVASIIGAIALAF